MLLLLMVWLLNSARTIETAWASEAGLQAILPPTPGSIPDPLPRKSDQPLLIVLVDFPDKSGSFTGNDWVTYFFDTGGFIDYFEEISAGQLHYFGDVIGATGKRNTSITAYVRLDNPITYYANQAYGFDMNPGVFPRNNGGVVRDALLKLDQAGFDYSPYADPGSRTIENLLVIFAGSNYGYTRDAVHSLEATAFRLSEAGLTEGFSTWDGYFVDNYTFCPEKRGSLEILQASLGICAHEHGHGLGMFDLYNQAWWVSTGVGYYDLMAYGAYGADNGQHPFHPSVVTKAYLGWVEPQTFSPGEYTITLSPAETSTDFLLLYAGDDPNSREYFLLENRQPLAFDINWQSAGLCPGLLIWHVDQEIVEAYALSNLVNTQGLAGSPEHPGVVLVEADGRYDMLNAPYTYGECSDTWQPGQVFNDLSIPSARRWDGQSSHISVEVLGQNQDGSLNLHIILPVLEQRIFLPLVNLTFSD